MVDSWFEPLRGVICLVQILSGTLTETDRISVIDPSAINSSSATSFQDDKTSAKSPISSNKEHFSVQDIGIVVPSRIRTGSLARGQMGYAIVGMRDPRQATPGGAAGD